MSNSVDFVVPAPLAGARNLGLRAGLTALPAHSTEPWRLGENSGVTTDEIKLAYQLLKHLRVAARDRAVHKFNVIGRSAKGEFESWLGHDISPFEKQSLIFIWDEFKRARLIDATGTDLVDPDNWIVVSPKGMGISEPEFATLFASEPPDAGSNQRLVDAVTGIFQRGELDADLDRISVEQGSNAPVGFIMIDLDHFKNFNTTLTGMT